MQHQPASHNGLTGSCKILKAMGKGISPITPTVSVRHLKVQFAAHEVIGYFSRFTQCLQTLGVFLLLITRTHSSEIEN